MSADAVILTLIPLAPFAHKGRRGNTSLRCRAWPLSPCGSGVGGECHLHDE